MYSTLAQSLLLGSMRMSGEQISFDAVAWRSLADRGLVTVKPLGDNSPAVVVTISAAGRNAALVR